MNQIIYEDILNIRKQCAALAELRGKSLLVTGATGFVGSFLIKTVMEDAVLSSAASRVYAIVRNETKAKELFQTYIDKGLLTLIKQDVTDAVKLEQSVDFVIHCASNAGPREYMADPVGTILTNCIGTNNILTYAKEHNVKKVLYLSTIEIYGVQEKEGPIPEDRQGILSCSNIRSCYPLSKQLAENLCVAYAEQTSLPVVIGRLSYLYGPGMKAGDSKVVAEFARCVVNGRNIVLKSKGVQKRSYCYISDAVSGLLTVLLWGVNGQAYNIASEKNITTIIEMAHAFADRRPDRHVHVLFDMLDAAQAGQLSPIRDAVLDNRKLKGLGWQSYVSLEEGIERMIQSMETDG